MKIKNRFGLALMIIAIWGFLYLIFPQDNHFPSTISLLLMLAGGGFLVGLGD